MLCLAVLVQYRRVTDGWTDGHTTTAYSMLAWRRVVKCAAVTDYSRVNVNRGFI